ncbi:YggL family protein [Vibrio natriegens]|uniref:YggL 50S ribosome-binding family protein n=1 Tax=Vibrio natriegens TaxID=691 RepID=UPI0008040353|nr:50S ribosome-binding protein YggL [Vibrio natriegens]ANQ18583.1 hypothetical protein BA891_15300 [Vibrio natriegens]
MATKRSRRLRKKLYVDEFKVLGFSFFCHLNLTNEEECDLLINDLLSFLEGRGLVMGGGADLSSFDGFVVPERRYDSASEDDRVAVEQWLTAHNACSEVEVSPLVDANQPE